MNTTKKISFTLYILVIATSLIFAGLYLFRSEFMSYHAVAVGMPWSEVGKEFQVLIIAVMRVCGGGWLATAIGISFLLFIPFKKGLNWANWGILLIGLGGSIPTLIGTLIVKFNSPANPPWIAAVASIVILIIGFIFAKVSHKSI